MSDNQLFALTLLLAIVVGAVLALFFERRPKQVRPPSGG